MDNEFAGSNFDPMAVGLSHTRNEGGVSEWAAILSRLGELRPILDELDLSLTARGATLRLGLERPTDMSRWLRSRHLPPFKPLRDWYYVSLLTERCSNGESIANFALRRNQYPSIYYRFVDRVTGHSWGEVRNKKVEWVRANALGQWSLWIQRVRLPHSFLDT